MVLIKNQKKKRLYDFPITKKYRVDTTKRASGMKYSILSDFMLKTMLNNEKRIKYACHFLSYYIDVSTEELLKHIKLVKTELDKENAHDKGERVDFVASLGDSILNIEVNCNDEPIYMERNIDYGGRLYSLDVEKSKKYHFRQVIQINLNNFAFKGNKKIVDVYYLQNEEGILLTEKQIYIQIYIPNLIKKWYTNGVEYLSESEKYLLAMVEPNVKSSLEIGGTKIMDEYLKEAINVSKLREIGESYDKEEALKDLFYREGQEKGIKRGIKEGIKVGIKETAQKMLEKGYKINEIIEITGLSEKEIKKQN